MRICADCGNQIKLHDKWRISGSRIHHVHCANPRLIVGNLRLQPQEGDPPLPQEIQRPTYFFGTDGK